MKMLKSLDLGKKRHYDGELGVFDDDEDGYKDDLFLDLPKFRQLQKTTIYGIDEETDH